MSQLELHWTPEAHHRQSDPATSRAAAQAMRRFAASQAGQVLAELRVYPGTAHELAARLGAGWDNVKVARRLPDLERHGLAKPVPGLVTGGSRVWEPTTPA